MIGRDGPAGSDDPDESPGAAGDDDGGLFAVRARRRRRCHPAATLCQDPEGRETARRLHGGGPGAQVFPRPRPADVQVTSALPTDGSRGPIAITSPGKSRLDFREASSSSSSYSSLRIFCKNLLGDRRTTTCVTPDSHGCILLPPPSPVENIFGLSQFHSLIRGLSQLLRAVTGH